MRYFCYIIFFLGYHLNGYPQNLLANGSFEEENICTEFKKNCAPEAWIGNAFDVNYYFDTEGWAAEGRHFVGLIAGNSQEPARRSFIRSRLLCGLRKGKQYRLEFNVRSRHPVFDSIGVYFSTTDFLFENKPYYKLVPVNYFRDTSNTATTNKEWKKISFVYTATGEEIFITIGSFKKKGFRYELPPEYKGNYYLYFDDIKMMPEDAQELLCNSADSIRSIVYEQNERHSVLEKRTYFYSRNVPFEPKPPKTVLQRVDTLIIPDILFATASSKLNESSFHVLDSFCVALAARNVDSLIVNGHTDSVGTLMFNNKLSEDRALSVSAYFTEKLPAIANLMIIHYFAYLKPVVSNQTASGRQRNRRVEIYLYTRE